MVLSCKALKQLLWESLTDKFCQYLKEFTKALHFFLSFADGKLCTGHFAKGATYC